jgi:HK97 gp10 family phage protein
MIIKMIGDHRNKQVLASIDDAPRKVRLGIRNSLIEIGRENVKHTRKIIKSPPKTGIFYGQHRASAPGEAPANRTGRLVKSVSYRVFGWSEMQFGDKALYGKFLENGTVKMEPRPHLIKTVQQKSKDNYNSLQLSVDRSIKR